MADPLAPWLLVGLTLTELLLLVAVFVFFRRLKRSEDALEQLQQKQEQFVAKLAFSAELEQELVASFQERQQELLALERRLIERRDELEELLQRSGQPPRMADRKAARVPRPAEPQAEPRPARTEASRQPTPKQIVLNGHKRGLSPRTLAQASGLSLDEVELILMDARRGKRG